MERPDHPRDNQTQQKLLQYSLAAFSFMLTVYFMKSALSIKPGPKGSLSMERGILEIGAAASMFINAFAHHKAANFRNTDSAEGFTIGLAATSLGAGFIAAIVERPEIVFGFLLANILNAVSIVRVVNKDAPDRSLDDSKHFLETRATRFYSYGQPAHKTLQYSLSAYNTLLAMVFILRAARSGSSFCLLSGLNQFFNAGSHYKAAHYVERKSPEKASVYLSHWTSLIGTIGALSAFQSNPSLLPLALPGMMLVASLLNALPNKKIVVDDIRGDEDPVGSAEEIDIYRTNAAGDRR